jgi:hypothetical protein
MGQGVAKKSIARTTGVPRSTVRGWVRRFAGVAQLVEAADLKSASWGFESLHQHQFAPYAYVLGLYLGDGCISRHRGSYELRIFLNRKQEDVIARCLNALQELRPANRVGVAHRGQVVEVVSYFKGWPALFPQHGTGRKHLRQIRLQAQQENIIGHFPGNFVRGLIDSDGCKHNRIVRGKDYPAYSFSNRSEDILRIFGWACDLLAIGWRRSNCVTISIARRDAVKRLDSIMLEAGSGPALS